MPSRLTTPVLTVDAAKIHQVDPGNADNLFGMWTVFSRCAESMEQGRRLENLSWRLWNRETFCCEQTPSFDESRSRPATSDVPALSESVDSVASDAERLDSYIRKQPLETSPPAIKRQDSVCSRGNQKHITSMELEKMISNIKDKKDLAPLSPHLASSVHAIPEIEIQPSLLDTETETETETQPKIQSQHRSNSQNSTDSYATNLTFENVESDHGSHPDITSDGSDTSISSTELPKSSSVVRGFSPSHVSSYRSSTALAHNVEASRPAAPLVMRLQKPDPSKKKAGMFTLGGSSGGEDSSFEDRITEDRVSSFHQPHRSSLSDGLSKPLPKIKTQPMPEETDLQAIRERINEDEDAIESDDDFVSESAIEEDDESDWEDSADEDSGRSTPEDNRHMFQRVDSRPNLVSRRSMLTKLIHEPDRAQALIAEASRTGPAMHRSRSRNSQLNGPSVAASPVDEDDNGLTMRGREIPSRAKPIIYTTTNTHEAPHSPRTTRRNMLATELTESLRHHLLWERQQKSTTANASKRRHTAHTDMNKLQEYPGPKPAQASREAASKNNSWNHYFDYGPWEYHVKGW